MERRNGPRGDGIALASQPAARSVLRA